MTRSTGLALAAAALALCAAGPRPGEQQLAVTSATLDAKRTTDGHTGAFYEVEFEFTEAHLAPLCDDETFAEIRIFDRDGHGGRHLLEDLEDCRMSLDGSLSCPLGVEFKHVASDPPRWRLAIAFRGRSPAAAFRGPVTVRLAYSVSGGPETVHVGMIASCAPARGGSTLTCRAGRKR